MDPIVLWIPGKPEAKPRPRACQMGKHIHIYQPKPPTWTKAIKAVASKHKPDTPFTPPIMVDILFMMPRPKAHYRTGKNADVLRPDAPIIHTAKPDRDNLDKMVLDTLQDIGYFENDSGVSVGTLLKIWANPSAAGIYVRIVELEQDLGQFAEWIRTIQSGALS